MDDSEADLGKLVHQLARRVPGLELDTDVVRVQVAAFKAAEAEILKTLTTGLVAKVPVAEVEESSVAKLAEEMKALPSRVAERLMESGDPFRRRRMRRFHPMMFEELMHMPGGDPADPVGILMAASMVRDDAPWIYELASEVYRAAKTGDPDEIKREMERLEFFSDVILRRGFLEEMGFGGKDLHMFLMEFPRMLHHTLNRTLEARKTTEKAPARRKAHRAEPE